MYLILLFLINIIIIFEVKLSPHRIKFFNFNLEILFLLNKINDGTVIRLSILLSFKKSIGLILSVNEIKGEIEQFKYMAGKITFKLITNDVS